MLWRWVHLFRKPIYNNVKQFRLALAKTVSWYNKSENLNKFNANEMVRSLSKIIGGGGGGNPLIAQGGGTEINSYDKIFKSLTDYIKNG